MVLKYPQDSLYRVYSIRYPLSVANNTIQPIIYIFGQNLKLKDSILLPRNYSFNFSGPIEFNNTLYWMAANDSYTCGFTGADICYGDTISVFKFNTDYSIVSKKKITIDVNYYYPRLVKYNGGFFYAHGLVTNFPYGIEKIFKLNNQLNKIDSSFLNSGYGNPISLIHDKIFLPGRNLPLPCQPPASNSGDRTSLIIDTNFIPIACDSYSNMGTYTFNTSPLQTAIIQCKSYPMPYLTQISRTKYLVFGSVLGFFKGNFPQSNSHYGVVTAIKDHNQNVVKANFFGNDDYETSFSEVADFYDIDKSSIAFVARVDSLGAGNFNPTLNMRSKIMVVKMDTMGNVIWKRFYGGEQYYQPRGLIFSPDGGILVSGIRFDSTAAANKGMPGISESFLLKLDSAGNYNSVGIVEQNIKNIYAVKVHPNPAKNQIQFELSNTNISAIVISALDGKQVYLNEHYAANTNINIETLSNGMYFYHIWTDQHFYTGKFLKE
ncbi:MAG: T9SS type A sorting domain-containing protein [Bacteroidota bacterium]